MASASTTSCASVSWVRWAWWIPASQSRPRMSSAAACYRRPGGRAAPGGRGPPRRVQPLHPAADVPVRRWRHGLHRVDYMRFCKMLANGGALDGRRVIGPRTLAYMACNHLPGGHDLAQMSPASAGETSRAGVGFGLGFACVLDPTVLGGLSVPGEYYWGGAASTAFWITPAEDLAVVFMTQVRPSSTYPIRRELRDYLRLDHRLGEEDAISIDSFAQTRGSTVNAQEMTVSRRTT